MGLTAAEDTSETGKATGKRDLLTSRRKALGLTQQALAGQLDVDRSTVARWERGEASPLPWVRPKLARALQVSVDGLEELLTGPSARPAAVGPGTASADTGTGEPAAPVDRAPVDRAPVDRAPVDRAPVDLAPADWTHADRGRQPLGQTARELATAVARQWTAESVMRSLGRPEPIRFSWSITRRTAAPPTLGQDLPGLITAFRQLPKRQLVLLGEPGAGKTALAVLLILGLLASPEPGEPVPVLLPVSSWNPRHEHLYTWLARRLEEEYPGLGNAAAYGPHAALRLVTDERVMPVLDGLDEAPPERQAALIDAIDLATAGGRPFVITCRSTEYQHTLRHGGVTLSAATVVQLQPVDAESAARFLTARQHSGLDCWQPVIEQLRRHPEQPLGQALSTPLMIDLARTAYSAPGRDPAELLDTGRFPDRASLEAHLLNAFLPVAYPRQLPPLSAPAGIQLAAPAHYEPDKARRWVTFLARHLHSARTTDLAWWQLTAAIPQPTRGLVFALPSTVSFAVAGKLAGGSRAAIVYGVAFGLAGFVANSLGKRPGPLRVELRFRGTAIRSLGRFAIGLAIGALLGLGWSLSAGLVLMLGLVFGLAVGVHVWLDTPADASHVSSPLTTLKQERTAALCYSLTFALSMGTFYVVADKFTHASRYLPVFGGSFDVGLALVCGIVIASLARLAFGGPGGAAYGLAAVAAGGLVFPRASSLSQAVLAGTVFGVAVGLAIFLSRAWGSFVLTQAWLGLRGKIPFRLMRFLADAHRRSVLRQVGAAYQFRHRQLQDNLASWQDR